MKKEINIKGHKITFTVIDKKLKNTLVCIHGFDSNRFFIGDLDKHINNFNIIVISYEKMHKLTVKAVNEVIKELFKKHLKHTKLFILGHSLGALFAAEVYNYKKIKSFFLLNPIHPNMWETRAFDIFKKIVQPKKSKLVETSINLLIKSLKWKKAKIQKFIDTQSPWFNMTSDLIENDIKMKNWLHKNYQNINHKVTFLVSKTDNIIFADKLIEYLIKNNFKYYKIDYEGHSPLSDKSHLIASYLVNIKSRKRWFWKNIIK